MTPNPPPCHPMPSHLQQPSTTQNLILVRYNVEVCLGLVVDSSCKSNRHVSLRPGLVSCGLVPNVASAYGKTCIRPYGAERELEGGVSLSQTGKCEQLHSPGKDPRRHF